MARRLSPKREQEILAEADARQAEAVKGARRAAIQSVEEDAKWHANFKYGDPRKFGEDK